MFKTRSGYLPECVAFTKTSITSISVGKIAKKKPEGVRFLLILHSNYSAMLSKIDSYRLLFSEILPTGIKAWLI